MQKRKKTILGVLSCFLSLTYLAGCAQFNSDDEAGEKDKEGHVCSFTNYVSDNNATCTQDGTKTAKCDGCDKTDTKADPGSKLGHDYGEWVNKDNATCSKNATKVKVCSRCNNEISEEIPNSKANHSYGEFASDNNATCTADGTKSKVCSVCGDRITETDANSALGHDYQNYVSDGNATCAADGTKTGKCSRCQATDTIADPGTKTNHIYIAQLGIMTLITIGIIQYVDVAFKAINLLILIAKNQSMWNQPSNKMAI